MDGMYRTWDLAEYLQGGAEYPQGRAKYSRGRAEYPWDGAEYPQGRAEYPWDGSEYPWDGAEYPRGGTSQGILDLIRFICCIFVALLSSVVLPIFSLLLLSFLLLFDGAPLCPDKTSLSYLCRL